MVKIAYQETITSLARKAIDTNGFCDAAVYCLNMYRKYKEAGAPDSARHCIHDIVKLLGEAEKYIGKGSNKNKAMDIRRLTECYELFKVAIEDEVGLDSIRTGIESKIEEYSAGFLERAKRKAGNFVAGVTTGRLGGILKGRKKNLNLQERVES